MGYHIFVSTIEYWQHLYIQNNVDVNVNMWTLITTKDINIWWFPGNFYCKNERKCRKHLNWENYISISFHIEWDMIIVTVFFSIVNQMEFHLVQNRKENCQHDHISFNVKGNGDIVFSMYPVDYRCVVQ